MSLGGRTFRAFRPSQYGRLDSDVEEEGQEVKQANIRIYSQRAQAGLPLFESTSVVETLNAGRKFATM